ncbi:hypothetical protein EGW08_013293, partial [Elysia chlorotica]
PPLKHKTVLIVSTEDSPAHTKFVEQLAKFLKTHCMCYVMDPPLEEEFPEWMKWSRTAIGAADHILMVDSPMAQRLLGTFNQTNIFITDPSMSLGNQMFKLTLDYIWTFPNHASKLILLHYGEECGCSWQYLKPPRPTKIRLPGGFPEMLRAVHKLTEKEAELYTNCLPLSLNYENAESGINSDLVSALQSAQRPLLKSSVSGNSDDTGIGSYADDTSMTDPTSPDDDTSIRGGGGMFSEEAETAGPVSPSCFQAASLIRMGHPAMPERGSVVEADSLDANSVITISLDPLLGSPRNPDVVKVVPPEPLDHDGRSFASVVRDFNSDDDGWSVY